MYLLLFSMIDNYNNTCPEKEITVVHEIFGYMGALGVSLILVPQVCKTCREQNVSGLSKMFLFLNLWTTVSFGVYGILENIWPMILSNIVSVCSTVVLICCYYKWHDKDDEGNSREVSRRRDRVFTENNGRDLGYDHDRVGGIHLYR